jgi:muramoyltetrapeptide carboxypeptidase
MKKASGAPLKPRALRPGSRLAIVAPASPAEQARLAAGQTELGRLGFRSVSSTPPCPDTYFADTLEQRRGNFLRAIAAKDIAGLVGLRGGYGSNYLLEEALAKPLKAAKAVIGYSDLTSLQIFLWQSRRWISFYGPMAAAGFDAGAGNPHGFDETSFVNAVRQTEDGWSMKLQAEALVPGESQGRLLGGCLTLLETSIGTPWELDTRNSILLLEDRGMKPWQVDRALMHLKQAGKLDSVRGIVLGDFPDCEPPVAGSPTVRDVCTRILGTLKLPIVFGAPVGHTVRPMLTVPLGVKVRLRAEGEGELEILEPAVVA